MDYGKLFATVPQEEGIKINKKFPKYTIGEKKLYTAKGIAQRVIFKGNNDIEKEYIKLVSKVRM